MTKSIEIKRGDLLWADLEMRPCVVVSNDVANHFSSLITIVPVTSQKLSKLYPHEVLITGVPKLKTSKAKVNQIRTIDKQRVRGKIAALNRSVISKIDQALVLQLDLGN